MGTDETLPPLLALPQSKSVTKNGRSPPLALHQWASDTRSVAAVTWDEFLPPEGIVRHLVCYNRLA
jgi:hypothetical protein